MLHAQSRVPLSVPGDAGEDEGEVGSRLSCPNPTNWKEANPLAGNGSGHSMHSMDLLVGGSAPGSLQPQRSFKCEEGAAADAAAFKLSRHLRKKLQQIDALQVPGLSSPVVCHHMAYQGA